MTESIDRRHFLAGALGVGALSVLRGPFAVPRFGPATPAAAAHPAKGASSNAASDHVVVLCTLYGGNDGMNTVVPYDDPAYLARRGNIAIPADKLLTLGNGYGINPAMPGLKAAWDAGELAVVEGVGYPDANLSHFQSMDIWQSGSTSGDVGSGWLGRWLDRTGHSPLQACSIGATVLPAMSGERRKAAALQDSTSAEDQLPQADAEFLALYRELQHGAAGKSSLEDAVAQAGSSMLEVSHTVSRAMTNEHAPSYTVDTGDIGNQFSIVSELIRAGLPTQVYAVSQGGFDTHAGELETQTEILKQLDAALLGFRDSIAGTSRAANTTVVVYTEFGRRVDSNASGGTDHGTANNVYVVGPAVKSGFYGEPPSLTHLDDNGNLIYTTDFRSVYATLLEDVLAMESKPVLGHQYPTLGFMR